MEFLVEISFRLDSFVDVFRMSATRMILFICVSGLPVTLCISFVNRHACS